MSNETALHPSKHNCLIADIDANSANVVNMVHAVSVRA